MVDIATSLATSFATSLAIDPVVEYDFDVDFEVIASNPMEITDAEQRAILSNRRDQMHSLSVRISGSYLGQSFRYSNSEGLPYDFDLVGWKSNVPVLSDKYAKFSYNEGENKWYFILDV